MVKPTKVTNSIRALRFAHGEMTQAELAERIGVTRQTVIAIEAGGVDAGVVHLLTGLPYLVRLGFGLRAPRVRVPGMDLAGQHVLITGAGGGVGTFAVQLAKIYDVKVTAVCGPGKADLVRSLGADHVIDYTREDFTEQPRRYDVIFDIAGSRPLSRLRRVLAPRGTLVLAGGENGGRWVVGAAYPLAGAADAVRVVAGGHATGKVVVTV
ncbi:zinc-binding dehydrogenase [Thermoactinospora rubra]|uniref:zinc-binding dehydrogenase n=1 Tax=Thermoactinospora rubra TaxID=1088767 RepID=UPI001F0B4719|nr:zinc-binding dehydrogenase [Thermoactinospora rubra]